MTTMRAWLNGTEPTADQLAPLAFAGFAHLTAMQVRDRCVRGLDLHLARLVHASEELFGVSQPEDVLRRRLHEAVLASVPDVSLTCVVAPSAGEFTVSPEPVELDVLVRTSAPVTPTRRTMRLDLVDHQRHLAHLKHVGEVAKTQYLQRAVRRGFDDAVFLDDGGRLSEATIWNLALWDGEAVVWPRASMLRGVTMQILARRLADQGVEQRTVEVRPADLGRYPTAAVVNSWTPGITVDRIGGHRLDGDPVLADLLGRAYAEEPPVAV